MRIEHLITTLGKRSYSDIMAQVRDMRNRKYKVRASTARRNTRAAKKEASKTATKISNLASKLSPEELTDLLKEVEE